MFDILSLAVNASTKLTPWMTAAPLVVEFTFDNMFGPDPVCLKSVDYVEVPTMTRTATIIAEMRSDNRAAIQAFTDSVDEVVEMTGRKMRREGVIRTGGPRYELATGKGRSEALTVAQVMLRGTETWDMNNAKRDHSLPKRALSMASSKGRCTPDMLASLMAFFSNPGDMASQLLVSFLPTKVSTDAAKSLLSDPFVVDVIEGLGFTIPTPAEAVKAVRNPATGRSGRAPSRLLIADGTTTPTVDAKRRGRPSGPKYVASLPFGQGHSRAYVSAALVDGRIPGGNDVAHGAGHDQGSGWDSGWNGPLTPSQIQRRNAALDAYHAETQRMAAAEAAE